MGKSNLKEVTSSKSLALSSLAVHAGAASRPDGITVSSVDGRSASEWYVGAFAAIDYYLAKAPRGRFHPERLVWTEAYYLLNKAKYHDPDAARLHVAAPVLNPAPAPLPGEDIYRTWGRKGWRGRWLRSRRAISITPM